MSDEAAFLAAIIAEPKEDTHRLVFADWLDERGQPDRAEFIRLQIEHGRQPAEDQCPQCYAVDEGRQHTNGRCRCTPKVRELRRREGQLLADHELDWCGPSLAVIVADRVADAVITGEAPRMPKLRRGFVEEVTCTAADWLTYADAIVRAHPVTRVVLTTIMSLARLDVHEGRVEFQFAGREERVLRHVPATWWIINSETTKAMLTIEWPGVAFELPGGAFRNMGTYLEADWTHGALPADSEATFPPGNS